MAIVGVAPYRPGSFLTIFRHVLKIVKSCKEQEAMPRARNIKPRFFDNSEIGKQNSNVRLLFIALWTLADKEGVVKFDLAEIRRYVYGYHSDISEDDVNGYLTVLSRLDNGQMLLLKKYNDSIYIIINNFAVHQNPHHTEKKGSLPSRDDIINQGVNQITVISPLRHGENPADSLIPDSLIPDSLIPDKPLSEVIENQFMIFKSAYPLQERGFGSSKDAKIKLIAALKKDSFENIMRGVRGYEAYIRNTGQSNKDAFRWLEKEGWRDDYTIASHQVARKPTADDNFTAGINAALLELAEQQRY